jgi:hypothetical protein
VILGLSWRAWLVALDALLSVLLLGLAVLLAREFLDRRRARRLASIVPCFERAERRPLRLARWPSARPGPSLPHQGRGSLTGVVGSTKAKMPTASAGRARFASFGAVRRSASAATGFASVVLRNHDARSF